MPRLPTLSPSRGIAWLRRADLRALDREIVALAWPALGALIAEPLFLLADSAMVGHLGRDPLAGLAIASTILQTAIGLMIFLAYAATPHVARHLGAGDLRGAYASGFGGIWLGLACGVVIAPLGWAFARQLVGWFTDDPGVADAATVYLHVSMVGVPAMLLVLAATGTLRGLQDTRTPLVVSVAGLALNVGLNALFMYGLGMGIAGSALGTVISQCCMAVWLVGVVAVRGVRAGASFAPHLLSILASAKDGVWLFVRTASLRLMLLGTVTVASSLSAENLAAYQIIFTLFTAIALGLDSLAIAAQAMIGRLTGEGDAGRVRELAARIQFWGVAFGAAVALPLAALSPVLGRAFTSDAGVLAALPVPLCFMALTLPIGAHAFMLDGILIGAADMRYLATSMLVSLAGFLPVLWLVGRLAPGAAHPLVWVWAAFGVWLMVLRSLTLGARLRGDAWLGDLARPRGEGGPPDGTMDARCAS